MPILDIEMVISPDEQPAADFALALADAAAGVFGLPAGRTWVKLRTLPAADYAENGVDAGATPKPVLVRVLKHTLQDGEALRAEAAALASAIAKVCGRPRDHVHILYEPSGKGRAAFGGVLIDD